MKGKVLYIGNLRKGGNGRDRMEILSSQGYEPEGIDTLPYRAAGPRLLRSLTSRWQIGPAVAALNRALELRAQKGGFDIVFVDKGTVVWPRALKALKASASRGIAVHYTPDASFADNRSRNFFKSIQDYDLLATTKPFEIDDYRRAGARELLLLYQGYGPRIDPKLATGIPAHLRSEVAFVGHCQPHYAEMLKAVAALVPLTIWGPGWPEYASQNAWAQSVVRGAGLYGSDYARALGGAKIAIGLLSKRVPETTTTRSFEIPAMGTMMIAERTDDHQDLFVEGREAEFFGSSEELTRKLKYYLSNEAARRAIAIAGAQKCRSAGYSTAEQFIRITTWLDQALLKQAALTGEPG